MKIRTLMMTALAGLFFNQIHAANKSEIVVDRSTQSIESADVVDASRWGSLTAQLVYSTANPQPVTINCGLPPFAQAMVNNWRAVQGRASTMTFTIPFPQNQVINNSTPILTINGKTFTYGVDWSSGVTSTNSIISLRDAVTYYANGEYFATASSNVLTVWAASTGSYANSWFATSSSSTVVVPGTSTLNPGWQAPFTNGNDRGYVSINGVTLFEGSSFFAIASSSITAKAIANAISTNSAFQGFVVSTHSLGTSPNSIIYTTSAINSADQLNISFGPGITIVNVSTLSMTPNISVDLDTVTISTNNFTLTTGLPVTLSTQVPNLLPNGLLSTVTYYILKTANNSFKLSPTRVAASTGGFINLSNLGVNNSSITVTPIPFLSVGTSGFKWQASNDGSSWADFSASSVTSTSMSASSSTIWNFGEPTYRYYRGSYSPALYGGHNIKATFHGREE